MISPEYLKVYLRGRADVQNEVGTITIGSTSYVAVTAETLQTLAKVMPRKLIHVKSAGGPAEPGRNHDIVTGRMDVRCFGKTTAEAWSVHDVVYGVLRYEGSRSNMNGKMVYSIYPSAGGIDLREPEGGWPYVWTQYTMTMSRN